MNCQIDLRQTAIFFWAVGLKEVCKGAWVFQQLSVGTRLKNESHK